MREFHRSKSNRKVLGVAGGIGEYYKQDPTIVRVIMALLIVFSGIIPGLLLYLVVAFILPEQ